MKISFFRKMDFLPFGHHKAELFHTFLHNSICLSSKVRLSVQNFVVVISAVADFFLLSMISTTV